MKRFMTAFVAGIGMMLATTAGVATAGLVPLPPSHPAPTQQSNDSDQGQAQVIPIAPQINLQNVNVLSGGVSQGNANNANTGQAAQQENGGQSAPVSNGTSKSDGGSSQAAGRNDSDQGQVQVIPIAPQVNGQNVNVLSGGVSQGNANNANTGQAAQQENGGLSVPAPRMAEKGNGGGGPSQSGGSNDSDQGQVQVIPIAPQVNGQNVNVLSGGVSQGDANNANTGQAAQQENGGQSAPVGNSTFKSDGGSSQAAGRNDSDQGQIQVVPIAPQVNLQNVNVASVAVEQGDANNANTGQAAQQENGGQAGPVIYGVKKGDGGHSQAGGSNDSDQGQVQVIPIAPQVNVQNVNVLSGGVSQGNANNANTGQAAQQENGGQSTPVLHVVKKGDSGSSQVAGRNDSDQGQVQIIPIAPQVNLQNVNVLSGGVSQGNANNANTGQAAQQQGETSGEPGGNGPKPCYQRCEPKPEPCYQRCEPKPEPCYQRCEPKPEPKPEPCYQRCEPKPEPCYQRCEPKPEPKPCPPKHEPKPCPPKNEPKPCPPKHEPKPCPPKEEPRPCPPPKHEDRTAGSRNDSDQHQVQIVPIAPQLNLQNVNLLSGGVTQGNANNANTGQAAQQSNGSGLPELPG